VVVELVKPRARKTGDFAELLEPFLRDRVEYDPAAVQKHLATDGLSEHVAALADGIARLSAFDTAAVEACLRDVAAARGVKAGTLIHATRVALTGRAVSPGLFEVAALMGQSRVIDGLRELERFLRARAS
jgi:glutamyl-tRNA synthetase